MSAPQIGIVVCLCAFGSVEGACAKKRTAVNTPQVASIVKPGKDRASTDAMRDAIRKLRQRRGDGSSATAPGPSSPDEQPIGTTGEESASVLSDSASNSASSIGREAASSTEPRAQAAQRESDGRSSSSERRDPLFTVIMIGGAALLILLPFAIRYGWRRH